MDDLMTQTVTPSLAQPDGAPDPVDLPPEEEGPCTYVIDTSVLLSDPRAMLRFKEHEVVLPVVVITELEGKRHHPELGYFARTALRLLERKMVTLPPKKHGNIPL